MFQDSPAVFCFYPVFGIWFSYHADVIYDEMLKWPKRTLTLLAHESYAIVPRSMKGPHKSTNVLDLQILSIS
jgi:hypothetical protein